MRLPLGTVLVALLVVAARGRPADAQGFTRGTDELISRRNTSGASSYVGGGATSAGRARTLQATSRRMSLLGRDDFEYMRGTRTGGGLMLGMGQVGLYNTLSASGGAPLSAFQNRTGEVMSLSGLSAAESLQMPLPGVGAGNLPTLGAAEYTPRPKTTPFEDYFGLTPARPAQPEGWKPVFQSVAGEMERQNAERWRTDEREGIALFKAATVEARDSRTGRYPNCRDCELSLLKAKQKLTMARDLGGQTALLCILLAHIALQEERPTLAIIYLHEAFERDPNLFSEGAAALTQYYGDVREGGRSGALDQDMRRYLRMGDSNPGAAGGRMLSAYCAWRLGDMVRLRDEAQKGVDLLAVAPAEAELWMSFLVTLRAAQP
jgi:hypothetical protein